LIKRLNSHEKVLEAISEYEDSKEQLEITLKKYEKYYII